MKQHLISFSKRQGFTLIELLVVVSIISILSAIGLSTFSTSRNKALDAQIRVEVKQAQNAMEANVSDTTGFYTDLAGSMFEKNSIPASISGGSVTYAGAAGARTAYCIRSILLKIPDTGNCSGGAAGVCTFTTGAAADYFCAESLR